MAKDASSMKQTGEELGLWGRGVHFAMFTPGSAIWVRYGFKFWMDSWGGSGVHDPKMGPNITVCCFRHLVSLAWQKALCWQDVMEARRH